MQNENDLIEAININPHYTERGRKRGGRSEAKGQSFNNFERFYDLKSVEE